MSYYIEGEVPTVVSGNGNGNGMFGNDGFWGIILLALLFGWGRNGSFGGYGNGGGEGSFGYQLGKLATTNDVASGFSTSEIMSDLNDIILGQNSGFAGVQQTLCQGFNGVNTALLQGFNGVDNAICTLGYNIQGNFNALGHQISDCCCKTQASIADLKYSNEKQTCDIIQAINAGNQRLVDIYTSDKISALTAENVALKGQISNNAQSRYITDTILERLSPCPKPAYITCNPATGLTYPQGFTQVFGGNGCSGCGNF